MFIEHGEEGHHHDDGGLGGPVETEPHHHDRRDSDHGKRGDEIAERQKASAQERYPIRDDRNDKARKAADDVAGQNRLHEGLDEIVPEGRERGHEAARDRGRCGHEHGGHAGPDDDDLPEEEQEGAEQDRDREADDAACALVLGAKMRQGPQGKARREPEDRDQDPEAEAGLARECRAMDHDQGCETAEDDQRDEDRGAEGGVHAERTPIRRFTTRSVRPTAATRMDARAAAAKSAAQIWIVWP